MKHALIILFSIISFSATAQNVNLKKLSIQTIAGTDYFVRSDTAASGEIYVTLRPVANEAALLAEQLQQVEKEIAGYDVRIDELQAAKKEAQARKKEIEKLQGKITPAPKTAKPQKQ